MNRLNREHIVRLSITLVILFSGAAMIPFLDLPVGAIGWELLAGVYSPDLSVNEDSGAPGSLFAFTGSDYPPDSLATIFVNGRASGQMMTDDKGKADFILNTTAATSGQYNVTMEVNSNASATESIELVDEEEIVTLPPGFDGPTIYVGQPIFLPLIRR